MMNPSMKLWVPSLLVRSDVSGLLRRDNIIARTTRNLSKIFGVFLESVESTVVVEFLRIGWKCTFTVHN
jgi:hypothetical protein